MTGDPSEDETRQRIWRNLVVAHSVILGKMEADLQATAGLTLGQYDVLLRLNEAPEAMLRMGDLAAQVLVTTSGVTRIIDRLETAGLVTRARVDGDRRVVTVTMTESGRQSLQLAFQTHHKGIDEYFASLIDPRETDELDRFFVRLVATHTNHGEQCDRGLLHPTPTADDIP